MSEHIQAWVAEIAKLAPGTVVDIHEEPHCPDPTCPLRHTVIAWTDTSGKARRAVIVKPIAYVRRPDVEQALRLIVAPI